MVQKVIAHELPQLAAHSQNHTTYSGVGIFDSNTADASASAVGIVPSNIGAGYHFDANTPIRAAQMVLQGQAIAAPNPPAKKGKEKKEMAKLRYVQIFIVDADENVPLDRRLIHKGEPFLTDEDDQSLFFGINIKELLAEHNKYRSTVQNKKVRDRSEPLEPIRISDLRMTVVNLAAF